MKKYVIATGIVFIDNTIERCEYQILIKHDQKEKFNSLLSDERVHVEEDEFGISIFFTCGSEGPNKFFNVNIFEEREFFVDDSIERLHFNAEGDCRGIYRDGLLLIEDFRM